MSTILPGEETSLCACLLGRFSPGRALGVISAACGALAPVPPTSILGAMLWTGYLGDLVATHLRIF